MDYIKCEICKKEYHKQSGSFTRHLLKEHNISLEDYIALVKYNATKPTCKCGFCDLPAPFNKRKYDFNNYIDEHRNFSWKKEQWILKYGKPMCPTCGKEILSWYRGAPRKYCSLKCKPNNWNQEKIKQTVLERYGVKNVFSIPAVKNEIRKKVLPHIKNMARKAVQTKRTSNKKDPWGINKMQQTCIKKYGVNHPSKILKNRLLSSKRMKLKNPMCNKKIANKMSKTYCENLLKGKHNLFKTKKYLNTTITYQSSYEYDFLELCRKLEILQYIDNGNCYHYLRKDITKYKPGFRLITDFYIKKLDLEIEIKSSYILEKQGGLIIQKCKNNAVVNSKKNYLLVLDKNYKNFLTLIKNILPR
jgi:hypothetical protein